MRSDKGALPRIYFAASIRGGREDAALYQGMISCLQERAQVLTEHVGDLALQGKGTDAEIYARDMTLLQAADAVIAECTCPSLGVGYEVARAEQMGKHVFILYDETRTHLSAMLSGNPHMHLFPYAGGKQGIKAAEAALDHFLTQ